ncbi:MAG: extracellular solute-binding protein [Beijerinckiaceae bacterium]
MSIATVTLRLRRAMMIGLWLIVCAVATPAIASESAPWRHAISLTGEPKYQPGFTHPAYVNPMAPKGGRLRLGALGTFDNFNPFVSGVKGNLASYLLMIYEPMLWQSLDEPTTEYGLLAEAVAYPPDYSYAAFRLRAEARWHDGVAVTADDVIFSFNTWKRLSPQWNRTFLKVASVEKVSEREVRFTMVEPGDAALPLYLGQMSILPKHWWDGKDASGKKRDVNATSQEPPLGSGPYRLSASVSGRSLSYERVKDYWGHSVPIRVGTENFDRIDIEYYRDPNVLLEAFKADLVDIRRELSLKSWVVGYDIPAVRDKRIIKDVFMVERLGITKAFVFNQRRTRFRNAKLRHALALAYSFDDLNRNVFHSMLSRPGSYFPNTDFTASGAPDAAELALVAALQKPFPPDALAVIPAAGAEQSLRANLFKALGMLKELGYTLKAGRLVDRKGEQLSVEFLLEDAAMERVASAYADNLQKLGIATPIRVVDDVQYQNRLRTFDFDIVIHAWVQGHAPGAEEREYWSTESADRRGTNNVGGLKVPLIDALVEKLILAPDRSEKIAAGKLLDRVLRADHIGVPISTEDREFIARWNRFGRPATLPRFGGASFPAIWWWDPELARKTGSVSGQSP